MNFLTLDKLVEFSLLELYNTKIMRYLYFLSVVFLFTQCKTQEMAVPVSKSSEIPYHQIPAYPTTFDAGNVAARMVDGLGYRYYWATKDLRPVDIAYRPSEDAQDVAGTLKHLYGLSLVVLNATKQQANIRPSKFPEHTYQQRRQATLENLKAASDNLKGSSKKDLEQFTVVFQRDTKASEFPFWNLINGPIADAIYHVGQIVSFRRTTGNPVQTGVNVFMGKTKE